MSLKDTNPVNRTKPKRIAIVLSNPAVSTTTGWPVGFWWSELTHPYYVFTEEGYEVEVFSPDGASASRCHSDPRDASGYSAGDLISMGFIATPRLAALVEDTGKVSGSTSTVRRHRRSGRAGADVHLRSGADLHRTFVRSTRPGR